MLSQQIPNIPLEFTSPIADDAADAEEVFQKRFAYIEHLSEIVAKQISEDGTDTELSRIVMKHIEDPDADTSDTEDLIVGFIGLIYESILLEAGFSEQDYNVAHEMADHYFNTEDKDGNTCLQRSSEITAGMDIYSAAFFLSQELIHSVNALNIDVPLHKQRDGHNYALN